MFPTAYEAAEIIANEVVARISLHLRRVLTRAGIVISVARSLVGARARAHVRTHADTFLRASRRYLYFIVEFNLPGAKFRVESIRPSGSARMHHIIHARAITA